MRGDGSAPQRAQFVLLADLASTAGPRPRPAATSPRPPAAPLLLGLALGSPPPLPPMGRPPSSASRPLNPPIPPRPPPSPPLEPAVSAPEDAAGAAGPPKRELKRAAMPSCRWAMPKYRCPIAATSGISGPPAAPPSSKKEPAAAAAEAAEAPDPAASRHGRYFASSISKRGRASRCRQRGNHERASEGEGGDVGHGSGWSAKERAADAVRGVRWGIESCRARTHGHERELHTGEAAAT